MILNLTDTDFPNSGVETPEASDVSLIARLINDEYRVDELATIILGYEPYGVIIDSTEEFAELLQNEMEDIHVSLVGAYEPS